MRTFFILMGFICITSISAAGADSSCAAAADVIGRVVPEHARHFLLGKIDADNGRDVFEIDERNGKIVIRGNNALALTSGFHWYLKHVAQCHVSWNGDQLALPKSLPKPDGIIRKTSETKHGFYLNYCTFNYTMAWWDWERWEREIDYMALCGIDMPLAIVGSEALWLNFLRRFGYSKNEAKEFIAGPGYTAWWMMGNLEGRGGPVTDEWIERQTRLQRKILARMRELGMRPALPGFVGLVPSTLARKNGIRTLPQGNWPGGHVRPHVLHPEDPKFDVMAKAWYEELEKLYGKADCFAGDLFHEGGKTHGLPLGDFAERIQGHMLDHNPNAIWTIQAWGNNPRKDLLENLNSKYTLVVDLCGEFWRRWESSKGFYGTPWVFSTIIMYGGNVGFHGRLDSICNNLNAALDSAYKPSGLGATWESIEVNPVVMDYLWDMKWRDHCPPPTEWVQDYAARRYGHDSPELRQAWVKFVNSVYGSYPGLRRPQESILCAIPSLNVRKASPFAATCKIHYDPRELRDALRLLLTASDACRNERTYQFDVVDLTRQFVANTAQLLYADLVDAFNRRDPAGFKAASMAFLELMDDQDRLLGCEPMYMLGRWLHQARNVAPNAKQADQNEKNARWLITTWTPQKSGLNNYAWREWNGLLKNYYKPRWQLFIDNLQSQLDGQSAGRPDFFPADQAWCLKTLKTDGYPTSAQGDPISVSMELLKKYSKVLEVRQPPEKAMNAALEEFLGTWEYATQGSTWRRVLHANGSIELFCEGRKRMAWKGFTWAMDEQGSQLKLKRANGQIFGTMKLLSSGKADFGPGMIATKIETGKNLEAEEASSGAIGQ